MHVSLLQHRREEIKQGKTNEDVLLGCGMCLDCNFKSLMLVVLLLNRKKSKNRKIIDKLDHRKIDCNLKKQLKYKSKNKYQNQTKQKLNCLNENFIIEQKKLNQLSSTF